MSDNSIAALLTEHDAVGLGELVNRGEVSALELTQAAIDRLEAVNPQLNAVVHKSYEQALAAAAGELPAGPFRGVPMLLKDLWAADSAGDPNYLGTRGLRDQPFIAPADSNITGLYRQAGFVIIGRSNTPEFGLMPTTEPLAFGPTRNPWNTDFGAGGSSGGAAAAVAAGVLPAAHASDGGGSIRIPAAMCGLVGLKPSRGRVTMDPSDANGFSVQHVVSRTVRDSAAILDISCRNFDDDLFTLEPPDQPFSQLAASNPQGLRIGLLDVSPRGGVELHPECAEAARKTAALLEGLGHSVELSHPENMVTEQMVAAFGTLWSAGSHMRLGHLAEKLGREVTEDDVEPATWMMAQGGGALTEADLQGARLDVADYTERLRGWWDPDSGFDLLLTPTTALPPPPIGELAISLDDPFSALPKAIPYATYTAAFNLTGQPGISLPMHTTADGLPVGAQLVAAHGREDLLLAVAAQLEQAAPWRGLSPNL